MHYVNIFLNPAPSSRIWEDVAKEAVERLNIHLAQQGSIYALYAGGGLFWPTNPLLSQNFPQRPLEPLPLFWDTLFYVHCTLFTF